MVCLFHTYCQYFAPKELHRDTENYTKRKDNGTIVKLALASLPSDVGVIVRDRRVMQSVVEKVIMMGD